MPGIENVMSAGGVGAGFVGGEAAAGMQVIGCGRPSRQRPLWLISPMPAYENSALGRVVRIAAPHDENPNGRLATNSIRNSFQPAIEPAQLEGAEIKSCVGPEFCFASGAAWLPSMYPRTHDQADRPLLCLGQLHIIQIRSLQRPRVRPTAYELYGAG